MSARTGDVRARGRRRPRRATAAPPANRSPSEARRLSRPKRPGNPSGGRHWPARRPPEPASARQVWRGPAALAPADRPAPAFRDGVVDRPPAHRHGDRRRLGLRLALAGAGAVGLGLGRRAVAAFAGELVGGARDLRLEVLHRGRDVGFAGRLGAAQIEIESLFQLFATSLSRFCVVDVLRAMPPLPYSDAARPNRFRSSPETTRD